MRLIKTSARNVIFTGITVVLAQSLPALAASSGEAPVPSYVPSYTASGNFSDSTLVAASNVTSETPVGATTGNSTNSNASDAYKNSSRSTFGIQLGYGHGTHHDDTANKIDLALVWDPHLSWWAIGGWHFGLVGEAHAVYWKTNGDVESHIGEFGLSPIFRFEKSAGYFRPYFEAGVGVRILTHARWSEQYTLSSGFQFADTVGVGTFFGDRQQYQVGYRFQHLSNAGFKRPNPGIQFQSVYVQYNF